MDNSSELVGYTVEDMALTLNAVEDSLPVGGKARLTLCSTSMATEQELIDMYYAATQHGFHLEYPKCLMEGNFAVTQITLQKGSPQWQLLIPLIPTIIIGGLIVFGITKIESIAKALGTIMVIGFLGLIILAVVLRKPAEKYLERGGTIPRLPETKKVLAAR